jgi:hypothetical protein
LLFPLVSFTADSDESLGRTTSGRTSAMLTWRDYCWVVFGWLLVPVTALSMVSLGLVGLTRPVEFAIPVLSAMAGFAALAYRRQLRDESKGNG